MLIGSRAGGMEIYKRGSGKIALCQGLIQSSGIKPLARGLSWNFTSTDPTRTRLWPEPRSCVSEVSARCGHGGEERNSKAPFSALGLIFLYFVSRIFIFESEKRG